MGAELDLDDVAGTSPKAMRELAELREELDDAKKSLEGAARIIAELDKKLEARI